MKVLVTGATGFIGHHLVPELINQGHQVMMTGMARSEALEQQGASWFDLGDISEDTNWDSVLSGVEAIIHLAGIAHRFESKVQNDWELYDRVNHRATRALAMAASNSPTVRHFVFMSTIRVHGDIKTMPITQNSEIKPVTPYDISKARAEDAIKEILNPQKVHWGIFRPVVVYGPGNRGNLAKLELLIRKGLPIPVLKAKEANKKSFIYVGNLVASILCFLNTPEPPSGQTWLLSDQEVVSTEDLIRHMAKAMNKRPKTIKLPRKALTFAASLGSIACKMGLHAPWNHEIAEKLLGDFFLSVDPTENPKICFTPYTMEKGIELTFKNLPEGPLS